VNIVIVGLGEVGRHLAGNLISQGHDLRLIESSEARVDELDERMDARVICGDGSSVMTLADARVAEADLFLALSGDSDANLMAASLAKALGVKRTIARVRIGSVQRGERLFVPTASDVLEAGDLITLFGEPLVLAELAPRFRTGGESEREASVVIFGGGEYGFSLARMLEGGRQRVRVLERNPKLCRRLSETLQRTAVIQGDATSVEQLKEEQVGEADFFIAATEDDEDNVMTCLQAKNLGTRYCLALVHRADYADVISRDSQQLRIRAAVSPREAALRDLQRYITKERSNTVLKLSGGAEVLEAVIPASGKATGRKVSEVQWPEGSVLVAQLHGSSALVPGADDELAAGDTIYALVSAEARRAFVRLLQA